LSTGFDWAVAPEAKLVRADISDNGIVADIINAHGIKAIIHFAGSISVPESMIDPLGYYQNNTANSLALIRTAIGNGVDKFVFSSTAAVYGSPDNDLPIAETAATLPQSPYGASKLMTEIMLADAAAAHDFRYAALRYFNVSGADPKGRTGQSTCGAINLIKVATEAALGKRDGIEVFGTDYPTRDGTCVRDFIHVTDLVAAHLDALSYLRAGGPSLIANCGYGRGYTVREVLDSVRRVSGRDFEIRLGGRRDGDIVSRWPIRPGPGKCSIGRRVTTTSTRSSAARWPGRQACRGATRFKNSDALKEIAQHVADEVDAPERLAQMRAVLGVEPVDLDPVGGFHPCLDVGYLLRQDQPDQEAVNIGEQNRIRFRPLRRPGSANQPARRVDCSNAMTQRDNPGAGDDRQQPA